MPLVEVPEDRRKREIERAAFAERIARAERREAWIVAAICTMWIVAEVYFLGLAMHVRGPAASVPLALGSVCAIGPAATVIVWRLIKERGE